MGQAGARRRIAAVLTAYHPDENLAAVVDSALESCELVVVADNTPSGAPSAARALSDPRVKVISSGRNLGLGGGLNSAVRELPHDLDAVLFLDQDSILAAGMVDALAANLDDPAIGIAAPVPWDSRHDTSYSGTAGRTDTISDQEAVITSGMLVRRSLLDVVSFREDLFIDWVDIAFCLDAGRTGARIVMDWRLRLLHSIGDCQQHSIGFRTVHVSHYPAWRLYWIARNAPILHREFSTGRARALASTVLFAGPRFATIVLFSRPRGKQAAAFLHGLADGFRGRVNPAYIPAGAHYSAAGTAGAPRQEELAR